MIFLRSGGTYLKQGRNSCDGGLTENSLRAYICNDATNTRELKTTNDDKTTTEDKTTSEDKTTHEDKFNLVTSANED